MTVDDCYQLGYVIKTHKLKGEIQIFLDVDSPEIYKKLKSMFVLKNNILISFFIDTIKINRDKALVKLNDINKLADAKALVSSKIYLPLSFLPSFNDGQYYYHEIIGFELYDGEKFIGRVTNVLTHTPQTLITVDCKGKEILVPLIDEVVKNVDLKGKRIDSNLPNGLIEIYLEDNEN